MSAKPNNSSELPKISLIDEEAGINANPCFDSKKHQSDTCLDTPAMKNQIRSFLPSLSLSSEHQYSDNTRPNEKFKILTSESGIPYAPGLIPSRLQTSFIQPQYYIPSYQYQPAINQMYMPVILQPRPQMYSYQSPAQEMQGEYFTGRLKFFEEAQNYGFFVLDCDGSDLFVHYDELLRAGLTKDTIRQAKVTGVRFMFHKMSYYGKYQLSQKAVDVRIIQEPSLNYGFPNYIQ